MTRTKAFLGAMLFIAIICFSTWLLSLILLPIMKYVDSPWPAFIPLMAVLAHKFYADLRGGK